MTGRTEPGNIVASPRILKYAPVTDILRAESRTKKEKIILKIF